MDAGIANHPRLLDNAIYGGNAFSRLRQLLGKQMSRKPLYYKGFRDKNGILIVLLAFWLDFQNFRRQIHAHFLEYLFLFGGWCRCPIKISIICGEMTNVKPLDFTTY